MQLFTTVGDHAIPAGTHQVRTEFAYDGGGLAKGGTVTLYDGRRTVGEGRVEATQPMIFSADETTDIGVDTASRSATTTPAARACFTGTVNWVQIDLGEDDHDHLITARTAAAGGHEQAIGTRRQRAHRTR